MKVNKLKLSKDATVRVRQLKGRTGLTPNVLCRFGFCLSLAEDQPPNPEQYDEEGMEFNRYTLTGEHDLTYMSLLRECARAHDMNNEECFRAHLNRGVFLLWPRIKELGDVLRVIDCRSS